MPRDAYGEYHGYLVYEFEKNRHEPPVRFYSGPIGPFRRVVAKSWDDAWQKLADKYYNGDIAAAKNDWEINGNKAMDVQDPLWFRRLKVRLLPP